MDALTALALHCRSNGLPTDYPVRIAQRLDPAAGYDPPLAALALQWAIEQGCLDRGSDAINALRTQTLTELLAVGRGRAARTSPSLPSRCWTTLEKGVVSAPNGSTRWSARSAMTADGAIGGPTVQ
jgi:hypothetical protein